MVLRGDSLGSPPCRVIAVSGDRVVEDVESFQVSISSEDDAVNIISGSEVINITDTTSKQENISPQSIPASMAAKSMTPCYVFTIVLVEHMPVYNILNQYLPGYQF